MPANRARALSAKGEKRALVGNLTMPIDTHRDKGRQQGLNGEHSREVLHRHVSTASQEPLPPFLDATTPRCPFPGTLVEHALFNRGAKGFDVPR